MSRKVKVSLCSNKGDELTAGSGKVDLGDGTCKFPFKHKSKVYNECVNTKKGDWCATKIEKKTNKMKKYAYCDYSLEKKTKKNNTTKKLKYYQTKIYNQIGNIDNIKGLFDLVIGNVQSGKTKIIMSHCVKIIEKKMIAVVIIRDSIADASQLKSNINKFNMDQGLKGTELELKAFELDKSNPSKVLPKYNTIIVKGNVTRLKNITDLMYKKKDEYNFCLCIDEVDLLTGTKGRVIELFINLLCLEQYHTLGLTATPMAVIMDIRKWKMFPNRIFKLEPPKNYVGINESNIARLVFHDDVLDVKGGKKKTDEEERKELDIIKRIMDNCNCKRKYCILLVLAERENIKQEELLNKILDENPTEYNGIVYNQGQVTLNPPVKGKTTIKDGHWKGVLSLGRKWTKDEEEDWSNASAIRIALQCLKEQKKRKIIIVSGMKADRGISFVDGDYNADLQYHLTDLYIRSEIIKDKKSNEMVLNKNKYCEGLIQKLRLFGVYNSDYDHSGNLCSSISKKDMPDECKLHLWGTKELIYELKKCHKEIVFYQDKLVQKTEELLENDDYIGDFDEWTKILENIKMNKKLAPTIKTAKSKMREKYKWKHVGLFDDIIYDEKTSGWTLKPEFRLNQKDRECWYNKTCNVLEQIDKIILKLSREYPDIYSVDKPIHQLTLYIPKFIDYSKSKDEIELKCKEIMNEPLFKKYKDSNLFKQLEGLEDYSDIYKITSFIKKPKSESYIKNRFEQLTLGQESKLVKSGVYTKQIGSKYKSPLIFRYGNYESDDSTPIPALVDINFTYDFDLTINGEKKRIESGIGEGDIIWWQNLFGQVFISTKSTDKLKELSKNSNVKFMQLSNNTAKIPCINPDKERIKSYSEFVNKYLIEIIKLSDNPFSNPNPEIKDLFNYRIIPKIIKLLINENKEPVNFILCDNKLNTLSSILQNRDGILTEDELTKINFYIIEINRETFTEQKTELLNIQTENPLFKNVEIIEGDFLEKTKEIKTKNKLTNVLLYADTSGDDRELGGWSLYNTQLIRDNLDVKIILGTYPVHQKFPWSNFGREIKQNKTIMYEYGRYTIMKTYISTNKELFDKWSLEYKTKNKLNELDEFDKEDVLEFKFEDYKKIKNSN